MLKNILNLEGAQKLSKEQQRNIVGGRLQIRNMKSTGRFHSFTSVDDPSACECTWQANDGSGWVDVVGACPTGPLEYSCIPE